MCDFLNLICSNAALISAKQKLKINIKININFYIYSQKGARLMRIVAGKIHTHTGIL